MSIPIKDYSDVNRLALGHITHEQLALKVLQQTRSSEELMSVLRAAHDRIQYFLCGKPVPRVEVETYRTDAEQADFGKNTIEFKHANAIREMQMQLDAANIAAAANASNLKTAEAQIIQLTERIETLTGENNECHNELTTAYMGKQLAEDATKVAEAKLADLMENYEVIDDDAESDAGIEVSADYYVPTKPELLEIALKHGFRVRQQADGKEDLNPYVYATIYEGIQFSQARTQ